ncbi:serine hydrolase domain-containing protein [Aestuariimicrobium sp. Y1814]|uniref:serine hydrolase domain-containing protein n=1 Tax=Aestuariimicrobium sp. Y1814 TaxID=3418742 RepID=UPI003DA750B6
MPIDAFFAELTHALAERARAQRQPSLSVAAALGGEVVWSAAIGDACPLGKRARKPTATTRYRIASITKPQVAVAVLALVEAGTIDLGAPMRSYLPDAPAGGATVAQFLSHTSGLVAEIDGPWWERAGGCTWAQIVAMDLPQVCPPGITHHYSNLGYAVLGRLLEVVHDVPWDQVLDEVVWQPLGMRHTARTPGRSHAQGVAVHPLQPLVHAEPVNPYLAMGPAGELWSTPSDLVVLGSFLAGVGEGRGVLRPDTLALMRHPATLVTTAGQPWTSGYGLGLRVQNIDGVVQVMHTGSVPGFTAHLVLDPRTGASMAVCGNSTAWNGGASDWLQALALLAPLASSSPGSPLSQQPALPDGIRALTGLWYRGPRPFLVKVLDSEVVVHPTDAPGLASHVRPDGDGRLVGTSEDLAFGEELRIDPEHPDDPRWFILAGLHHTREPYDPDAMVPGGVDEQGWRQLR